MNEFFESIRDFDESYLNWFKRNNKSLYERCIDCKEDAYKNGKPDAALNSARTLIEDVLRVLYYRFFEDTWGGTLNELLKDERFRKALGDMDFIEGADRIRYDGNRGSHSMLTTIESFYSSSKDNTRYAKAAIPMLEDIIYRSYNIYMNAHYTLMLNIEDSIDGIKEICANVYPYNKNLNIRYIWYDNGKLSTNKKRRYRITDNTSRTIRCEAKIAGINDLVSDTIKINESLLRASGKDIKKRKESIINKGKAVIKLSK